MSDFLTPASTYQAPPVNAVRQAVLREACVAAEAWQARSSDSNQAVCEVLAAESHLSRQLCALHVLMDAHFLGELGRRLDDTDASFGMTFVCGLMLLQHDQRQGEAQVFAAFWQAPQGVRCRALSLCLQLCGVWHSTHIHRLVRSISSADEAHLARITPLVIRIAAPVALPRPHLGHAAGRLLAVRLMGLGLRPFDAKVWQVLTEAPNAALMAALQEAQQLLWPDKALAVCRKDALHNPALTVTAWSFLGLMHDAHSPMAAHDRNLMVARAAEPDQAAACLYALGLMGCRQGAQAAIALALQRPELTALAARCVAAVYGLDDDALAPFAAAAPNGDLDAEVLQKAVWAATQGPDPASDFQPRTAPGLIRRLLAGDMRHVEGRALEWRIRSRHATRLCPWAFLTPQLTLAYVGGAAAAPSAVPRRAAAPTPTSQHAGAAAVHAAVPLWQRPKAAWSRG